MKNNLLHGGEIFINILKQDLEIRTASIVASLLDDLGFDLELGKDVMSKQDCMGKPAAKETKEHLKWALKHGANPIFTDYFSEGYTGIVATFDTEKKGPTMAYRFDMDALDINETDDLHHFPNQTGFKSTIANKMHACGHDTHMSIGLGLATLIAENKDHLSGKIKLIFQPAKAGTRGAKSMVKANVITDVDYFIGSHIGCGVPHNHFVATNNGFLATSKLDVTFKGVSSHAGSEPEKGKNALLAASSAVLNIYAIARHSGGTTRVNVGELHAGSGRNIIADQANLKVETRGETSSINQYMKEQVESIIVGTAAMYQMDYQVEVMGEGLSCQCSNELAEVLDQCAKNHDAIEKSYLEWNQSSGSEDATFYINEVQKNGGLATYCIFGTDLAAGHHNEKFDVNEETFLTAVEILYESIEKLCQR